MLKRGKSRSPRLAERSWRRPATSATGAQRSATACPYFLGKQPVARDLLKKKAMNGDNRVRSFLTSHVGAGSSWEVLFNEELINFST